MGCKVNCSWCWRLTIILTGVLVIGWLQPIEAANLGGELMELKSTAFAQGGKIPGRYTCDGQDISPPSGMGGLCRPGPKAWPLSVMTRMLRWEPGFTWIYYDIPAGVTRLPEQIRAEERPATGGAPGNQ